MRVFILLLAVLSYYSADAQNTDSIAAF